METIEIKNATNEIKSESTDAQNVQVTNSNYLPRITPPEELPIPESKKGKQAETGGSNEVVEQEIERLRDILRETRICTSTVVPEKEFTLEVDGTGFFTKRDIHAVKAKAKAGKTTVLKVFVGALLLGMLFRIKSLLTKPRIVYFDTEQNRHDTKAILEDVIKMTKLDPEVIDSHVVLQSLRRIDRTDLLLLLQQVIIDEKPNIVFIDGLVEFVASFNNEEESKEIIKELLKLSEDYNCAIVCVLHTNKAEEDHQMRGHLGTMLAQKAGTVLECNKRKGSPIINVSCSESRSAEPKEWSIMFDAEGNIVDADAVRLEEKRIAKEEYERRKKAEKEREVQERLDAALEILTNSGGTLLRSELTEKLKEILKRERTTVSKYLSQMIKDGKLFEAGKYVSNSQQIVLNL